MSWFALFMGVAIGIVLHGLSENKELVERIKNIEE